MIKNYFLVALRGLRRNAAYLVINTLGLGIALACCITAYLSVAYNIEFDSYHDSKVTDIYTIHSHIIENDGRNIIGNNAPMALSEIAFPEISGIESYTRYLSESGFLHSGDEAFSEEVSFADSTFFNLFHFELISGDLQSFQDKYHLIITNELASKLFGDEPAVGKIVTLDFANNFELEAIVGAVIKKMPDNSSFVFKALLRLEVFRDIHKLDIDNWSDWHDPSTFIKVSNSNNLSSIEKQLNKFIPIRNESKRDSRIESFKLESFKSYFSYDDISRSYSNLRKLNIGMIVFSSLALLILLIACFNLTNTSIAMTSKRLKEVGIRKAIGAIRGQIIMQFLLETVLTITASLLVGLLVAQWIVPEFGRMWNMPFALTDLNGLNLFIALLALVFFASLLAGVYPALLGSKFKPVLLLKGQLKFSGTNWFTKTLIAFQFALAVIVLIGGVVFQQNAGFQESIDYGYDREKILNVMLKGENTFEALSNTIEGYPKIESISVSDNQVGYNTYSFSFRVDTAEYNSMLAGVGKNYFETVGFKLKSGRFMNFDNSSDRTEAVIVNQALLNKLKWDESEALDKIIELKEKKRRIVGVVENHVDNLFRSKVDEPFIFYPADSSELRILQIRAAKSDLGLVKKYVESAWKEIFPNQPFNAIYQDDIVMGGAKWFNGNLKKVFLFLTILGALLSASGIFSMASLTVTKRTKEIGVRKVLGASARSVALLVGKEFTLILAAAVLVGGVAGFFGIDLLLGKIYTRHIDVGIFTAIVCSLLTLVIGALTTSSTILKAATSNPVKTLRSE